MIDVMLVLGALTCINLNIYLVYLSGIPGGPAGMAAGAALGGSIGGGVGDLVEGNTEQFMSRAGQGARQYAALETAQKRKALDRRFEDRLRALGISQ